MSYSNFLSHNLTKRVLAALALLPPVILVVVAGGLWYGLFLVAAGWVMGYEWQRITGQRYASGYALLVVLFGTAAVFIGMHLAAVELMLGSVILLFCILTLAIILALVVFEAPRDRTQADGLTQSVGQKNSARWAIAAIPYVSMALLSLGWLRTQDAYGLLVFWMLLCVWAMDVGGYFVGRAIGGAKLAPRISPKKTWAGLWGGMALAAVVSGLFAQITGIWNPAGAVFVGMILAVVAQIGDLFESYVKRRFDCKDSGSIIPGHGGVLDRVDGILFAAPLFAAGLATLRLLEAGMS